MGATQGRPALWHLPFRRNPFFTGREQVLSDLRAMLLASASAALVQPPAISGLGGIGKTQTAIEYAYRYQAEYSAVLWMQASSRETLITDITRAATLLHLPEQDAREQDKIVQALKHWLEANSGWLLIFDNADDLHIVSDVLPTRNSGHILFTTRATAMSDLAQRVPIDEMDRAEGSLLLLRRAKRVSTDAPLTNASEADLRKDAHPEPVATTWAISFKNVQQANPAAADLLRLCAFLAPDDIPEQMIIEASKDIGTELQSLVKNPHNLNLAIRELLKYSLVRRNSAERTIIVHRLVQAVLRVEMDKETQKQWAERTIRVINKSFPDVRIVEMWPRCQQLLPHALMCAAFIMQWDLASPRAARLLNQAGYYLSQRARYQDSEPLYKRALATREEVQGPGHPDTATSVNNLAFLYWHQGKLDEAEQLLKRALAIREEALGDKHPDTAYSLNNLASLYHAQGKLTEAEPLLKEALATFKKVQGPDHPDTRAVQNNYDDLLQQMNRDPQ
jgi:tetratricopeptide (TPR) repeat protein